jgi:ATP-dependent helicase/nuclease subunit B
MLAKHCPKLTITLTLDKKYDDFAPNELDLFRTTAITYQKINALAEEAGVSVESTLLLNDKKRFTNTALNYLEENFNKRPVVPFEGESEIQITGAVNRRVEIENVAREILHLVKNHHYRFHELAILVRNPNDYTDLLKTILEDFEVPYFLDQKRSMLHHPLIEFIRSSIDIVKQNWRYDAVFRCVKTDLLKPLDDHRSSTQLREEMDILENYVLAHGIKGNRWKERKPWSYRKYSSLGQGFGVQTDEEKQTESLLHDLREMIASPLTRLERDFAEAITARDYCIALYEFLEKMDVPKKVERWRTIAEERGKLGLAREHDQVWQSVMNLLDETVEVLGDEEISLELFQKVLDTGIESMRFALVPPAIDQVLIASIDRSRFFNVKCSFIIGVNDGVFPAKMPEEGILTDNEREILMETGMELAPTSKDRLLDEQFLIYLALISASEKLYVSYPLADEEGKSLLPSIIINQLKEMLPNTKEVFVTQELDNIDEKQVSLFYYLPAPNQALSVLSTQIREWKKGYPLKPVWWEIYNWFQSKNEWKIIGERMISSLFYQNTVSKLSNTTSEELYGTKIKTSISRMEKHSACPFSQFISYGLKLQERKLFRLEAPDIGQLFHAALKDMAEYLRIRKMDWRELSIQDCYRIAAEMVEKIAPQLQSQILLSSNRHHYLKRKLTQVVGRASYVLSEQAKASGFSPAGLELGFGTGETLPPIRYELDNGFEMELVGRIDRVDTAESPKGLLLRVIDYKSSQTNLNLSELYYGITLQMLTYLDVIITHSEKWLGKPAQPAGVLYFHVHDPIYSSKKLMSVEEIERELFKKFKMKGLVLEDEEVARIMDNQFETRSEILPLALKKDGSFYSNSSVIDEDKLTLTRNYVRGKMKEIGTEITNGVVDISPYQMQKKTPCTYCAYKPICQFDSILEENEYRILQTEKEEKLFEMMKQKGGN